LKEIGYENWIVFITLIIRASGGFVCTSVISSKVHRHLCWNTDSVNIVFPFLYPLFYNYHHPVGFLKVEEFLEQWRLFVHCVFKLIM